MIICWSGQILHDFNELADWSWEYLNLVWWIWLELFDFLWIRAVWVDLGDFNRFDRICVDLKGLRWIYLEDRYNLICVGFEWFRWMRVETATYLDGSGKIWMALSCFDWIWADLVGFGWIWAQIRVDFLFWMDLIWFSSWLYRDLAGLCKGLDRFSWI